MTCSFPERVKPANAANSGASYGTILLHGSLGLSSALAISSANRANCEDPARRPNVVVILADDLGWADLGCYGSKYHRTPHLDRLAAAGMRFTDAYAACPVCSPTRAALLTGKYPARLQPHRLAARPARPPRPEAAAAASSTSSCRSTKSTLAEALKAAGYATGHIGKWHLGGKGFEPQRAAASTSTSPATRPARRAATSPRSRTRPGRFMPGLEKAPDGEYLTDRLTAEAEKFIEANKDRPFFLYLAHYAVHIPLQGEAGAGREVQGHGQPGEQGNPIYAAMVESLDDSVGRVAEEARRPEADRATPSSSSRRTTAACATLEGPNTPPTINAPLREGKGYLYEGGIRVPLIVRWPGVAKPGTSARRRSCSIDLFPTLLDAVRRQEPTRRSTASACCRCSTGGAARARCPLLALPALQQPGRPAGRRRPRRRLTS